MKNDVLFLAKEYKGDVAWEEFVSSFGVNNKLERLDELKAVIVKKLGGSEIRMNIWFDKKISALGGNTPNAILLRKDGLIMLRTLVMRMP